MLLLVDLYVMNLSLGGMQLIWCALRQDWSNRLACNLIIGELILLCLHTMLLLMTLLSC